MGAYFSEPTVREIFRMNNHRFISSLVMTALLGVLGFCPSTTTQAAEDQSDPSRYNVTFGSPSKGARDSMPLGNGEVALNAWFEEPERCRVRVWKKGGACPHDPRTRHDHYGFAQRDDRLVPSQLQVRRAERSRKNTRGGRFRASGPASAPDFRRDRGGGKRETGWRKGTSPARKLQARAFRVRSGRVSQYDRKMEG